MAKGILYIMSTAVPGLLKIGKTGTDNYEERMRFLESNGYRNVTSLKREFAIEVNEYDEKERLLHIVFAKSRISDTELFALDLNTALQLLSAFDGTIKYPLSESKEDVFVGAAESSQSKWLPDGLYTIKRDKSGDKKPVKTTAEIRNGEWILKKGSQIGLKEDTGVSAKARKAHASLPINEEGLLLDDYSLGECSPSFAGTVAVNQSVNGWMEWKDASGDKIDKYRVKETDAADKQT